jgi:hypothetical protein
MLPLPQNARPDRQTVMFSATFPKNVEVPTEYSTEYSRERSTDGRAHSPLPGALMGERARVRVRASRGRGCFGFLSSSASARPPMSREPPSGRRRASICWLFCFQVLAKQVLQNDPVQVGSLKPGFAFGLPEYPWSTHRVPIE